MAKHRGLIEAEQFDAADVPIYHLDDGKSFKSADGMSRVRYHPGHLNPAAPNGMQGEGELTVTWIYGEEPDKNEGLLLSDIELVMDSHLAPGASIGLHPHHRTEELYYLLSGQLTITLIEGATTQVQTLHAGDSHRIVPGQSHYIVAGDEGARFMVVAATVDKAKR